MRGVKNLVSRGAALFAVALLASTITMQAFSYRTADAAAPAATSIKGALGVRLQRVANKKGYEPFEAYERWIGRNINYAHVYYDHPQKKLQYSGSNIAYQTGPDGLVNGQSGGHTTIISVPLVPETLRDRLQGGNTAANLNNYCSNGSLDNAFWKPFAFRLVQRGLHQPWPGGRPKVIIRPGWEHNGGWFPWSSAGAEAEYARCWRHVHSVVESIAGRQMLWEWNVSATSPARVMFAYPGDRYVDIVGNDFYDKQYDNAARAPERTRAEKRLAWARLVNGDGEHLGINHWVYFAASHGKKYGVSEWGLQYTRLPNGQYRGGFDSPYFIDQVAQYFSRLAANRQLSYMIYFETNSVSQHKNDYFKISPGGDHQIITARPRSLNGSRFPRAGALFLQKF